jgi:hypothetical protein
MVVESRVDSPLAIQSGGRSVKATGPILSWDADEVSAIASVVLVQALPGHGIVFAGGASARVENPTPGTAWPPAAGAPAEMWSAEAAVTRPVVTLQAGYATAYAHAIVENIAGELETYDWMVHLVLQ